MPDYSDLAYALGGYGRKTNPYDTQRKYGYDLLKQGTDTSPILSPWQGAARLAQALAGGVDLGMADYQEKAADKKRSDALAQAMAEPDPQKRIGLLAAYDPDRGAAAAGQLAVEQAKLQQQKVNVGQLADGYGGMRGVPAGGATAAVQPLPQGAAPPSPAGFANNSGNIRSTAPGNYNGFATYDSPQAGASAHFGNFQAYVQQNPNITVAQAIAKWSPPNENNTQGIIRQLAESTGINPGMPLSEVLKDPAVAATLLDAQTRLEKGGLPQGFNANTFMQATGGAAPASGPPVQLAQGGPPPFQGAPQPQPMAGPQPVAQGGGDVSNTPPAPNPAGMSGPSLVAPQVPQKMTAQTAPPEMLAPYVQRLRSGFYGYGPDAATKMEADVQHEFDRKYEADKLGYEQGLGDYTAARSAAEHDRQQNTATPSNEMALAGGFADRMTRSNGILAQMPSDVLASIRGKIGEYAPFGTGGYLQSPAYIQAKQARDDFINAQLRRESGAAIAPSEYANADKQYFPQPNDPPEVLQQKAANRQLAIEGMVRGSGPTYKPSPTVGAPQAIVGQKQGAEPPQPAVERLKANPSEAAQFDEIFGQGASARVLGR